MKHKEGLESWQADGNPGPFMDPFLATLEEDIKRHVAALSQNPHAGEGPALGITHGAEALGILSANPATTAEELGRALSLSARQAQRLTRALRETGLLHRVGSRKNGHWVVGSLESQTN